MVLRKLVFLTRTTVNVTGDLSENHLFSISLQNYKASVGTGRRWFYLYWRFATFSFISKSKTDILNSHESNYFHKISSFFVGAQPKYTVERSFRSTRVRLKTIINRESEIMWNDVISCGINKRAVVFIWLMSAKYYKLVRRMKVSQKWVKEVNVFQADRVWIAIQQDCNSLFCSL